MTRPDGPRRFWTGFRSLLRTGRAVMIAASLSAVVTLAAGSFAPRVAAQAIPEFDVDVMSVQAASGLDTGVDIYTRLPFTRLRFLASPEGFTAQYQVSADLVAIEEDGTRGNVVQSPIWDRTVRTPNYAETNLASRYDFTTHRVSVPPGDYLLEIQIEDRASAETYVRDVPITVRELDRTVAISDVLLLNEYDTETNTIYPNVSAGIPSDQYGFTLYYELYPREAPASVVVHRTVERTSAAAPSLRAPVSQATEETEGTLNDRIVYSDSQELTLETGESQHIVNIEIDDISVGDYVVLVEVRDPDGGLLDYARRVVRVEWSGLQEHLQNLDDAIAQLTYVAKPRDIRHIRDADSESDRWGRFLSFWERRDPTPGTARNEKMEEYYYRAALANRRYSSLTDGWRTDRGQVIILFGEPDFVERHPYNFSVKPYEVWYYWRNGRRFVFVDQTGLGDYQLLVPIWDETTRLR